MKYQVAPSRERGLKQKGTGCLTNSGQVAPSRERGLKPPSTYQFEIVRPSRSFTGAWIETPYTQAVWYFDGCRSFTGAWIETVVTLVLPKRGIVAPSRERGLKPLIDAGIDRDGWSLLHGSVD